MTAGVLLQARREAPPVGLDDRVIVGVHPGGLPALIRPRDSRLADDVDAFMDWFREHKAVFDQLACVHGALLFRGFPINGTPDFQRAIDHYPTNDMTYVGGAAPRAQIAGRVMESTQSPKHWPLQHKP